MSTSMEVLVRGWVRARDGRRGAMQKYNNATGGYGDDRISDDTINNKKATKWADARVMIK